MSQSEVGLAAGCSRHQVARVEHGHAGAVGWGQVRQIFEVLGARVRASVWWNGAALDRLLDERHAALVERTIATLEASGWMVQIEVTFSVYGERGSIDVLAAHAQSRALLVIEVKTALGSLEETNRMLDIKERLAARLGEERFGWVPSSTSRALVLPEDKTLRRVVARHGRTMGSAYPGRSRDVRAWLRDPRGRLSAIWFLSDARQASTVRRRSPLEGRFGP